MLMNCQLENDGKQAVACDDKMSLKLCTTRMDPHIYQVYSYMLHRVTGVCSAIKQDQFNALTEITVNQLMQASQSQLGSLQDALAIQKRLSEISIISMREFEGNDEKIKQAQNENLNNLKDVENLIIENIKKLDNELEIREKSETKLESIDQMIHDISLKLVQQSVQLHQTQENLFKHVEKITEALKRNDREIFQQYNQTLSQLESFKSIIATISKISQRIKNIMDKIFDIFDTIGLNLDSVKFELFIINILYYSFGWTIIFFCKLKSKVPLYVLGSLSVLNGIAIIGETEIPLDSLNFFIWILYFVFLILNKFWNWIAQKISNRRRNRAKTPYEDDDSDDSYQSREPSIARTPIIPKPTVQPKPLNLNNEPKITKTNSTENNDDDKEISNLFESRPMTPAMRRVLTESVGTPNRAGAGTPFLTGMAGRIQCSGITARGLQCKNAAVVGMQKCRLHN